MVNTKYLKICLFFFLCFVVRIEVHSHENIVGFEFGRNLAEKLRVDEPNSQKQFKMTEVHLVICDKDHNHFDV